MSVKLSDLRVYRECDCEPPWPACAHMPRTGSFPASVADLVDALIAEGGEIVEAERARNEYGVSENVVYVKNAGSYLIVPVTQGTIEARCDHGLIGAHHIAHYGCDGNGCDQHCLGGRRGPIPAEKETTT